MPNPRNEHIASASSPSSIRNNSLSNPPSPSSCISTKQPTSTPQPLPPPASACSPNNHLEIVLNGKSILTDSLHLTSTSGEAATFTLAVPPPSLHGTITRQYQGTLEVHAAAQSLTPIVSIATETAVASIVLAESPPNAPQSFLETQSIVSRSFLLAATTGHTGFDFCDTTHCQFLREPPPPDSPATIATRATRDLHLIFEDRPFAAIYSRSCGGRTHTLAELGLPVTNYPYYAVIVPSAANTPSSGDASSPQFPTPNGNASPSTASRAGPPYLLARSLKPQRSSKAAASATASASANSEQQPSPPRAKPRARSSPTSTPTPPLQRDKSFQNAVRLHTTISLDRRTKNRIDLGGRAIY